MALSLVVMVSTVVASAQVPDAVGLWEFENSGDLGLATAGADLSPTGAGFTAVAGPGGGDAGAVTIDVGSYYSMAHGIAPNDGGSRVNEWTLLVDFQIPALGVWHAFFQTDATPGRSDAEYFVNLTGNIGVGTLGYSASAVTTGTWYRMVFVWDGDNGSSVSEHHTYLDGSQISLSTGIMSIDGRFGIATALLLFSDNNAEDNPIDVSNIAIWDHALSAADAATVGAPGATIPFGVPPVPLAPVTASHLGSVEEGVVFVLTTTSGGSSYQWFKNDSPMSDGGNISGTNTNTLTINTLTLADSGTYHATFDDGSPQTTVSSTITVYLVGSLPVGGIISLAIVAAALALGGAMSVRRKIRPMPNSGVSRSSLPVGRWRMPGEERRMTPSSPALPPALQVHNQIRFPAIRSCGRFTGAARASSTRPFRSPPGARWPSRS